MNTKLVLHNVKASWRNLMKYKTQNVIAVLCLSVGMVCFCVTLFFLNSIWGVGMRWRMGGDERCTLVHLHDKEDSTMNGNVYFTAERLKLIADSHLSSIRFIEPSQSIYTGVTNITDKDGKQSYVHSQNYWVSPEWLNYQGLRSAITGKRIPVLKPGDIVMTKTMLERTFGRGIDPRGFTTTSFDFWLKSPGKGFNTIVDVVDTGDLFLSEDKLYVVTNLLQETNDEYRADEWHMPLDLVVRLAEGKTRDDLQAEMQELFPQYKVKLFGFDSDNTAAKVIIAILFIIGSCVLLVGLLGFLKMQTQLFRLRLREMGLRRCMGATGSQLLCFLVCEMGIVFLFVAPLTLLLTFHLADYGIPVLRQFYPDFTMDMPRAYGMELCICLAVFLLTAALATLSARKVVRTELSTVVGKSCKVSTRGRSLLIIMQMVVSQIFVCICCIVFYAMNRISQNSMAYRIPTNKEIYKDCIALKSLWVYPQFVEKLKALDDVETVSLVGTYKNSSAMQVDENFLPMLGLKLDSSSSLKGSEEARLPVFDANADNDSTLLGFTSAEPFPESYMYSRRVGDLYVSDADSMVKGNEWFRNDLIIIKAKQNRYNKAWKEVSALYHEAGTYRQVDAPMENFYDVVFRAARWLRLLQTIVLTLTFVTLLSIVLTTFSSVSLDTKARQKEVAIRKACGANRWQIMWLFAGQYVWQLIISSIISIFICFVFLLAMLGIVHYAPGHEPSRFQLWGALFCCSIPSVIVALVTLLTVGYKIYKVSKLEPASIIKKE